MDNQENSETANSTKDLKERYTAKYDDEEIDPLKTNGTSDKISVRVSMPLNEDPDSTSVAKDSSSGGGGTNANGAHTDNGEALLSSNKKNKKFKEQVSGILIKYEISNRAKRIISILLVLLLILLVSLITIIALWPSIPDYMKMDVCKERDCFDASAQVSCNFYSNVNK